MKNNGSKQKIKKSWYVPNPTLVLIVLLAIFFAFSVFNALNLQRLIIPDEEAHFLFSKHYSNTLGIPPDVPETYALGWYIEQNPFLYYWINGRIINFLELIKPSINDGQLLISLRLVNAVFALGTVFFCFLLSKEIIQHPWWQLFPVFLLTNTLMFVFLSGGVNYDNLANLFSMAGLYYLVRVFHGRNFLTNSLGWMISIMAGTLVKYPLLPLALTMAVAWIFFVIKNKKRFFPANFTSTKIIALSIIFLVLLFGNLAIYGYNLVAYQAIRPSCRVILTEEQCLTNPYANRFEEFALEEKLTIQKSIALGYLDPLTYTLDSWVPNMFYRIFGILGHRSYFPTRIIIFYRLLFYWIILLIIKYWQRPSFTILTLMGIFIFYALVLLYINYNSELVYGFKQIAMQGRYIFPVIGAAYVVLTDFVHKVPNKVLKLTTLAVTLTLFFLGGPIKFIRYYDTIFSVWFIK